MGKDKEKTPKTSLSKAVLMAENARLNAQIDRYMSSTEYFRERYSRVGTQQIWSWVFFAMVIGLSHLFWVD